MRTSALNDLQRLVRDFEGHELDAALHRFANYVLHLVLEQAPPPLTEFISEALVGQAAQLSKNRFGCRTILRIFRHQLPAGGMAAATIADEVIAQAPFLLAHEFGNYVVQELLERGSPGQKREIASALCRNQRTQKEGELLRNATRLHASRVLQKALTSCCAEDVDTIVNELLRDPTNIQALVKNHSGRHVAQSVSALLPVTDGRRALLDALLALT